MSDLAGAVSRVMPGVLDDLKSLVRIPSVAFPGFASEPVLAAAEATADVLRRSGLEDVRLLDIPGGYPAVFGEIPAPPGAPTLTLYAHYDVQPAPIEQGWDHDPFDPIEHDGRIHGRGAADDKSGIAIHAGTLRAFGGRPPVGVKVIIEGEEETISHLHAFVEANPAMFDCDAFLVADMGNLAVGEPALTTTLRGEASCIVRLSTLDHPLHSGQFGGPGPDALIALIRLLATLHDDAGNVTVPGLTSFEWEGPEYPEDTYRAAAAVHDGVALLGEGPMNSRLWSRPSLNVIGIDAPSVQGGSNLLIHEARARLSLRTVPGSDSVRELQTLMDHVVATAPWGARVECERVKTGQPFVCPTDGRVFAAAERAMSVAFSTPAARIGCGATIPLLKTLQDAVPTAEFILWGAEDIAASRIHGSNESVDPKEIERLILTQATLMSELAE